MIDKENLMNFRTGMKRLVAVSSAVALLGLCPMAGAYAQGAGAGGAGGAAGAATNNLGNQPGEMNQNNPGENSMSPGYNSPNKGLGTNNQSGTGEMNNNAQ